jgi:DNA invertase Pin-like site-specific DNA recombinase
MNVHVYLRRSKNDEGKQQFSVDVQRTGCREFVDRLGLGAATIVEHLDDGKAGDDFHSRQGIRQLLEHAKPGDVIVCRDQSRLGRDAIEVTLVVRDLIRDRGCRLFY